MRPTTLCALALLLLALLALLLVTNGGETATTAAGSGSPALPADPTGPSGSQTGPTDPRGSRPPERKPALAVWRLRGQVSLAAGDSLTPVVGARVVVESAFAGTTRRVGTVETDTKGRYELLLNRLSRSHPDRLAGTTLRVMARARGLRQKEACRIRGLFADRPAGPTWVIDPVMIVGSQLGGRVVDSRGRAVAGARVALQGPKGEVNQVVETDAKGLYHIPIKVSGLHQLRAVANNLGSALLRNLDLSVKNDAKASRLVLAGDGVIACTVLGPGGKPLVGQNVTLAWDDYGERLPDAGMDDKMASEGLVPELDFLPPYRSGEGISRMVALEYPFAPVFTIAPGLLVCRVRTDRNGTFRASGLLPGTFRILVGSLVETRPGADPFYIETGRQYLWLTIDARQLFVRVVDAEGRPLHGATIRYKGYNLADTPGADRHPTLAAAGEPFIRGHVPIGWQRDCRCLLTPPATLWKLEASVGAKRRSAPTLVTVAREGTDRVVTLVVTPR